jgi:hypothetical protein
VKVQLWSLISESAGRGLVREPLIVKHAFEELAATGISSECIEIISAAK